MYTLEYLTFVVFTLSVLASFGTLVQLCRWFYFMITTTQVDRNMMKTYGIHHKYNTSAWVALTGLCWVAYFVMEFFKDG